MEKGKGNFSNFIKMLKENEDNFKVLISKNSQIIFINDDEGEERRIVFSEKKLNPKIFHVSKKIKSESDIFLHYNSDLFKQKDRGLIRYYNYNPLPKKLKRFFYIDISSCYITCLNNKEVISDKLFEEINKLPKQDRLISLGMLAYEPYEVVYEKGKRKSIKRVENKYSPIFYYACALTMELMETIIKKIENKYLFYWVDGIFFKEPESFYLIKDYLKTMGFKFRFGSCYNLKVKDRKNHNNIVFYQSEKGEFNKKEYNIPYYFEDLIKRKENYNYIIKEDFINLMDNFKKQQKYGLTK